MKSSVDIIPLLNLSIAFIPALIVCGILYKWSLGFKNSLYAMSRMLVQLLFIGYFLSFIFDSSSGFVISTVLAVMVLMASWISLRTIETKRKKLYSTALLSLGVGGGLTLLLISQGVLDITPWYSPRYLIPVASMIFSNALNSISLAAERFTVEMEQGKSYLESRNSALRTSLIPITNSLFAVGLVSIPGMMTGQILSGISPLVAARYQIMVMCMIYGASGISSALFLTLIKKHLAEFEAGDNQL